MLDGQLQSGQLDLCPFALTSVKDCVGIAGLIAGDCTDRALAGGIRSYAYVGFTCTSFPDLPNVIDFDILQGIGVTTPIYQSSD